MPKSPKVAIITPVFNLIKSGRTEFIKQNIESIHNQTYENLEHIVQDGASTDGTLEFLKEYADKGWIKLYSEKDKNVHDAINKAAKKTDAQYLGILGSDDYYKDNDIIEYIVNHYLQDETVDYVFGDEENISVATGEILWLWKGDLYKNIFWRGVFTATSSLIFSKRIFDEVGGFDLKYSIVGDVKLQMQFKLHDFKGIYCNRIIDVFRKGIGLSSTDSSLFFHTNQVADICSEIWKNFDETITPEKAEYMLKYDDFDEIFLMKLRRWIISLNLKNFDYVSFNRHIEDMIAYYYDRKRNYKFMHQVGEQNAYLKLQEIQNELILLKNELNSKINGLIPSCENEKNERNVNFVTQTNISFYPFKMFPMFKIIEENNCKKYYVFGIIPILKIQIK